MGVYSSIVRIKNKFKGKIYSRLPAGVTYRQSSKPNVLVFSSRRGGSTLLAQIIAADQQFRYVDQPFDMTALGIRRELVREHCPDKYQSQFISLNADEEKEVKQYLNQLLSGHIPGFRPRMHNWPAHRTVIKICNALPLLDWMSAIPHTKTIFLYRHPVPQALSVVKNNWELVNDAFLRDQQFVSLLSAAQLKKAQDIVKNGTQEDNALLNWVLENYLPLKSTQPDVIKVSYEELVLGYQKVIGYLCEQLELNENEHMYTLLERPSASYQFSDQKTREAITSGDSTYLLRKWMSEENSAIMRTCDELLEVFEIDHYRSDHYLPLKKHFIFPEHYAG